MLRPLLIATSLSLTPALAQAADAPKLQLQATGTSTLAPDMATLNLSVMREAETAAEALQANSEAMTDVLAEMQAQGIEERDLQTTNFNIRPLYDQRSYNKKNSESGPRIIGYAVSNSLTVRVRNLDNLGTILDRSVTLGVNSGGDIVFSSSKAEEARTEARANAVKAAIAKANTMADAANMRLGRIVHMSEQGANRPRMQKMAARTFNNTESMAVPIAAGEGTYSVTVTVHWEIAP